MPCLNSQHLNFRGKKRSPCRANSSSKEWLGCCHFSFFIFQSKLQALASVGSLSCQAGWAHILENTHPCNCYPKALETWISIPVLFQDKGWQHERNTDLFKQPTVMQRLSWKWALWTHLHLISPRNENEKEHVPMPMMPSIISLLRDRGQGASPCPCSQGDPAWPLRIFWGAWARCARHKFQVPSKVPAFPLFPVCQAEWSRVYFWSIKAIRGLKW